MEAFEREGFDAWVEPDINFIPKRAPIQESFDLFRPEYDSRSSPASPRSMLSHDLAADRDGGRLRVLKQGEQMQRQRSATTFVTAI